ncbi:MAG: hypothetical protein NVSMB31_13020 [Vulcanimicrobiaceae bacterium]
MKGAAALLVSALLFGCAVPEMRIDAHPRSLACTGPVNLTVLGDSLARGWGASRPEFTLVNRVFRHLSAQRPHSRLYNLSAPGVTAREIIARQLPGLRARPCSVVFVVSGANEVQQYDRPSFFERDYTSLLAQIRSRDPEAVLVCAGVPDVSLAQKIPFFVKPPIRWLSPWTTGWS